MIKAEGMTINDFIDKIRLDFVRELDILIDYLHPFMSTFAAILVSIFIVYKVILYMTNPDKGLDPYVIIRPCLILAGIIWYKELVDLLMIRPMGLLSDIIEISILEVTQMDINEFNTRFDSSMTTTDPFTYDIIQITFYMEMIHLLIYFVGSFVASYMLIRQALTIAIYYITGYFSLILSLIPGNDKSFFNWGLTFLAVLLWSPLIMILKYVIIITRIYEDEVTFQSIFVIIAIQISSIFLFLKVPRFCEFLINGGSPLNSPFASGAASSIKTLFQAFQSYKSLRK